jgi:RNA polymerase sigma factor (sigma-70 family)
MIDIDDPHTLSTPGPFEARYLAFLETITNLRARLHRYCARMTGSVLDGEGVVQEALFEAYRKLDQFDDRRALAPWLFRIAHNRCIDFLRRRKVRQDAETAVVKPDRVMPVDPPGHAVGRTVEYLVLSLPPKERACVLLKDVFLTTRSKRSRNLLTPVWAVSRPRSTAVGRNWRHCRNKGHHHRRRTRRCRSCYIYTSSDLIDAIGMDSVN